MTGNMSGTLEEKLFHACSQGDGKSVKHYLELGANMNVICIRGRTPFGAAAQLGNLEVLKVILDHSKDVEKRTIQKGLTESEGRGSNAKEEEEASDMKDRLNKCDSKCSRMESAPSSKSETVDGRALCATENICRGKSCDSCKSIMLKINKTNYDLACFNDSFVRQDPRFKSQSQSKSNNNNGNSEWNALPDEAKTQDGLEGMLHEIATEESGSSGTDTEDGSSGKDGSLYSWLQICSVAKSKPHPNDLNMEDQFGCTALHYAAIEGHLDAVKLLINSGCRVNVVDQGNVTPLHLAAARDVPEMVKLLIEAGADIHKKTADRISPLHVSASRGLLENVKLLVEAGSHIDPLDSSDRSPLFIAVSRCHDDVVSYLLTRGAHVNAEEIHGYTPLFEAVSQKSTTIVKMLLDAGAKTTRHHYLLHYAILHRHEEMVRLLISADPRVNAPDEYGDTPLIIAARTHQPRIAKLLLEHGAFVNYKNRVGNTALHEAIRNTRGRTELFEEMLSVLEEYDVDFEAECELRCPALDLSAMLREREAAVVLIRHGAKIDSPFDWRIHNLFWFPREGWNLVVELLIYAGYNIRAEMKLELREILPIPEVISRFLRNPMRLSELCRIQIRSMFKSKVYQKVRDLPVPSTVKTFLKLEDIR